MTHLKELERKNEVALVSSVMTDLTRVEITSITVEPLGGTLSFAHTTTPRRATEGQNI